MHDIEPYYNWRDRYVSAKDSQSPFYGREYSEFQYSQKVYNFYIHPQWDYFGSQNLYLKVLFADYDDGFAIIELIGEWNDCLNNDVMFLKREVADQMIDAGIYKFILICENVLNFHGSDDCYYEEWYDDVKEESGWLCFINTLDHVEEEMQNMRIQQYVNFGDYYNDINWRPHKPKVLFRLIEQMIANEVPQLMY